MRLFVGIPLSPTVRDAAARVVDGLRDRIEREAPAARVRWVPPENLHVTLWFLGEVADAGYDDLMRAVSVPFAVPPFTMGIRGAGAFPERGSPRTLWFGLSEGRAPLVAIYDVLSARLPPLGFPAESRPYSPHLTIPPVKELSRRDVPPVRAALASTSADIGTCRVDAVTLFRSRTSPRGSQYEALLRVPLA